MKDVIVFDNTEKIPMLIKNLVKLECSLEDIEGWTENYISRCPRCQRIFFSRTGRKYCSKECQYNRKDK